MPIDDRPQTPQPSAGVGRRGFMLAALIGGLIIAVVSVALVRGSEPAAKDLDSAPTSSGIAATTTSIAEEDEVVARLRDILQVRDRAYRDRDVDLLRQVYTSDCPCLRGDGDAIRQLLNDDAVWIGASTSVRINRLEKQNDRLWVVVADFIASPFRIETESGDLIRAVDERVEPFRFVLTRKSSDDSLLLGFAAPIDESD
jgi:ketosteroid isomerase-like protein